MSFRIVYLRECLEKDIPRLDRSILRRVKQTIESRLAENPTDFGKPLRHTKEGLWSLRVGDWRIIYRVTGDEVLVVRIGHRREVYGLI